MEVLPLDRFNLLTPSIPVSIAVHFPYQAEAVLEHERALAKEVIPSQTAKALLHCVTTAWVVNHAKAIVANESNGCAVMFGTGQMATLGRLYRLFSNAPETLTNVQTLMKDCIVARGESTGVSESEIFAVIYLGSG